jgi:hypothetical protein
MIMVGLRLLTLRAGSDAERGWLGETEALVAEDTVWVRTDIRPDPIWAQAGWRLPAAMPLHAITFVHGLAAVQ